MCVPDRNVNMVPLALLNGRLAALTGLEPPGYAGALRLALDGALPAQRVGGRWFVAEADLGAVAIVLGMMGPLAEPAAPNGAGLPTRPASDGDEGAPTGRLGAPDAKARRRAAARFLGGSKASTACSMRTRRT